jgi:hypothetical protein
MRSNLLRRSNLKTKPNPTKPNHGKVCRNGKVDKQGGVVGDLTCERCLEDDESATHILCDCDVIAYLRFLHLGQYFLEPSDYYDAPKK